MPNTKNFVIEISCDEKDPSTAIIKITAKKKITLYELAEALYDCSKDVDSQKDISVEYCSFDGEKKFNFRDHAIWMNQTTVLSDIARQIKV